MSLSLRRGQADDVALLVNGFFIFDAEPPDA